MKYRTESFGGSMERDAVAVISFEIGELGNDDVVDYLTSQKIIPDTFMERCEELAGCYAESSDNDVEMTMSFVEDMLAAVKESTGRDIKYAVWLADKANVWRYWKACEDCAPMEDILTDEDVPDDFLTQSDIDTYDETNGFILSDLGEDGALYGFESCPLPTEKNEV